MRITSRPYSICLPLATAGLLLLAADTLHALPIDRARGRQEARDSRQDGRYGARDARQDGRQTSRARRYGYYTLPAGSTPFVYSGVRYYRTRGLYYYPYFYGGRTVYVQVDVNGGYPAPPPAAGSIDVYFD